MRIKTLAAAIATLPFSALALAAPASTSAYVTDEQSSFVQDATSEGIDQLNMIMCVMSKMAPETQVNQGAYVAMVDQEKCEPSSRSDSSNAGNTSAGATASTYSMRAVVDVTRATNSDPMIGKIWIDMTEEGMTFPIFVRVRADQAPTTTNPYGVFRMDYCGKLPNQSACMFNGYIEATTSGISYFERGMEQGQQEDMAMTLSASSTTTGAGSLRMTRMLGTKAFNFAFNPNNYRRSDGTDDKCFARSQSLAKASVWRYGTYDADTGARIDSSNPGFPVKITYNGTTYFGFASYWGLHTNGLDLNSFPDGTVSGLTITRESRNSQEGATYSLQKLSGKLTKYTKQDSTLAAIDKVPLQAWADFATLTGNALLNGINQVELYWDNSAGQFVITGKQSCDQNGCRVQPLDSNGTLVAIPNTAQNAQMGMHGWSQALGGEVNVPGKSVAFAGTDAVSYYVQSVAAPGGTAAPTALKCLNNCPTGTALSAFLAGTSNSPYDAQTQMQWGAGSTVVTYAFGGTGLTENNAAMTMTDRTKAVGQFQWGMRSGKLFDTATLQGNDLPACSFNGAMKCEPHTDYYVWESGPNPWNQYLALVANGQPVSFDPPTNVPFTPTTSNTNLATGHALLGKTLQLQFNGFGELNGIPGKCVNPVDNSEVACGSGTIQRWVPAFAINDGTQLTIGSRTALVKYLDRELRLSEDAGACSSMSLSTATLPAATGLHDPSSSADTYYIGAKPTVTAAPKVIHGVVQ